MTYDDFPWKQPWIQTLYGGAFPLVQPSPRYVNLFEIGGHLAKCGRYVGATEATYTVAQHSCVVHDIVRSAVVFWPDQGKARRARLYALLHDAHEAFTSDIPTPWKRVIIGISAHPKAYDAAVDRIDRAIFAAAGLAEVMPADIAALVHGADGVALVTETRDLCAGRQPGVPDWTARYGKPLADTIPAWPAITAEVRFIDRLRELLPDINPVLGRIEPVMGGA